jgi:hypothetical protein
VRNVVAIDPIVVDSGFSRPYEESVERRGLCPLLVVGAERSDIVDGHPDSFSKDVKLLVSCIR